MIPGIAFAVFLSALFAGGAGAACPQGHVKTHAVKATKQRAQVDNCVDLGAVPQISAHIVAAEPQAPAAKPQVYSLPGSAPYEGPTLGLTKPEPGVRPAPTVGYHWSLD